MKMNETNQAPLKVYKAPELKDLGKLGEVTNASKAHGSKNDGGTGPNYYS